MHPELREQVEQAAFKSRRWAERKAEEEDFHKQSLKCWCARASAELFKTLTRRGIGAKLHMFEGERFSHVFVVVDDHIVDITATQFSPFRMSAVVIMHLREAEQYEFYQAEQEFSTVEDLRKYQIKKDWAANELAVC